MIPLTATEACLVQVSKKNVDLIVLVNQSYCESYILHVDVFLNPAKQRVHSLPGLKQPWVTWCVPGLCRWADPANTLSCPAPVSPPPASRPASGAPWFVCSATASCQCHCVTRTAVWLTRRLRSCLASTKSYFLLIATNLLGSPVVNVGCDLSFSF